MGLAALRRILEPHPVAPAIYQGRTLAVDADNLLWMFVTAMRDPPRGPDGRPIAHLIGLGNRLKFYASQGMKSVWVFDGEQPHLKADTLAGREERLVESGGPRLTEPQMDETKALMDALGIPWLVAPGESDAQCAHFTRAGISWASVTQDYDAALHASPRTLRNLVPPGGSKTPEMIDLAASLERAGLTREQLVDVAILIGTDYNLGVKGVGPVKAVKLVKEHGDLHGALAALRASIPHADDVRALFLAHPVAAEVRPAWRAPDAEAVAALFASAGLSAARAEDLVAAQRALVG